MEKSILIISSHYYPETGAGAKRATSFAEFLATKGWKVTVITLLPNYPYNKVYEGYRIKTPYVSVEKGVKVIRLKPLLVPKDNFVLRLFAELVFSFKAFLQSLKVKKANILLVTTPYMLLGPTGFLWSKIKRTPYVWDVRDLTWLYPRYAGKRTFGLEILFEWIMKIVARRTDVILAPVQGIVDYFKPINFRTYLIPNGVSSELLEKSRSIFNEYRIEKKPLVMYAGLFGYMHGLSTLIEAVKKLPQYEFSLIGDGPERKQLIKQSGGLNNIEFLPYVNHDKLLEYYRKATVCVSLVRAGEFSKIAEPSKVWEYMAVGRPVVYCGEGPLAKYLEENGLAVVCPPGDPEALASAIKKVVDSPEQAKEMARRAREFVEKERVREKILEDFERELQVLLLERGRVRSG